MEVAALRPRLDDGNPAHSATTTRRRKKCSHYGTLGSVSATGSVYGYPGKNASTLAYHLPYSTSASSQTSSQTSQAYANPMPHQAAGQASTSGSSSSGSSSPEKAALGSLDHVSSGSLAGGSGNAGGFQGVCPLQSTVTVTTQYTITVTQAAAIASTADAANPLQYGSIGSSSKGPSAQAQNGSGNDSDSSNGLVANGISAKSSISSKGTKCGKKRASGTAAVSASTAVGGLYGNGTMRGSKYPVAANASSRSSSDTSSNSTASSTGKNSTVPTNYTSDANLRGEFWAGGMCLFFSIRVNSRVYWCVLGASIIQASVSQYTSFCKTP